MTYDYDLFVIGAGSGGVRASRMASEYGAKVAVAEELYLGGTCVNVGCVPKKLFVYASQYTEAFKTAAGFGWSMGDASFDWERLRDNKSEEIRRLNTVYQNILQRAGVDIIDGKASIVDPNRVTVGDKIFSADKILIATGGWPRKPVFPGAEHVMTSNEVFYMERFPDTIIVQGGGYIAVEFAGILNGLGCNTELLYRGPLFLRGFDQQVREFTLEQMAAKGVKLSFDTDIQKIEKREDGKLLVEVSGGETRVVDAVLSAIGRSPKTAGLGLENTAVILGKKGEVIVDENFQTAEANIYALGDVVGRMELTPVALAEGMYLAKHLFASVSEKLDYYNIPTAVFCQPNIATVGYTEELAREKGHDIDIYQSIFKPMKNSFGGSESKTLMKLIVDKTTNKVIGAHMVGEDAGEIIQGIAIAIKAGATKTDFDSTIGIHPTSAEEFVTMRTAS